MTYTHDQDTSTASGVLAQVGRAEGKDGGVHGGLEEEDDDEDGDGGDAVAGADVGVEGDGAAGVDDEQEVALEHGRERGGDEATDGEGDQCIRQHAGGGRGGEGGVLGCVVDEEGGDGDLGTDLMSDVSFDSLHSVVGRDRELT